MPERKEYEMPDDYKQALRNLLDRIKTRDWAVEKLKTIHPSRRANLIKQIDELNRGIDRFEQALANEYELVQELRRVEEEYAAQMEELDKMADAIMADMKEKEPELYRKIKAELGEDE